MNNKTDEQIFKLIINSAKRRFDYSSFAENFKELSPDFAENLLLQIIVDFAENKNIEIMKITIVNKMMMIGLFLDESQLFVFLNELKEILKFEISTMKIALDIS
jgi:hypothetical protein